MNGVTALSSSWTSCDFFVTTYSFHNFHQLFINDNQGGEETTVINSLSFIGVPVEATNMSDFKRVRNFEKKDLVTAV